jgi:glycosyltransferase involved in cell wall biosynthesis
VLCGRGDSEDYIREKARQDSRIQYLGQVTPAQARELTLTADVLVNPRQAGETYTKYSFPSKNIEYLLSGNPVVAYMLESMPECYRTFIYEISPDGQPVQAICRELETAMKAGVSAREKYEDFYRYARENLMTQSIARAILRLSGFGMDPE